MPFDINYQSANFELVPANLLGTGWPASSLRLVVEQSAVPWPAVLMVSSALFYWFCLVKFIYPMTRPTTDQSRARTERMRDAHNIALFVFSAFSCLSTTWWLWAEGQLFDWTALLCTPVEGTWLRALSVAFTISKIYEMGDTAFIVWLGKRPPEFLHLYHHATTFWLFCHVMCMPGAEKFGLIMNGGVHTLMYSHYWRSWPKPYVPLITLLQIAQLITVTYTWGANPSACPAASFASAPSEHPLAFVTPYAMVPVYLVFFIIFFVKRFVLGSRKKAKRSPAEAEKKWA